MDGPNAQPSATIATSVNLGHALSDALRELAAVSGRDFAGEARAAVRSHLIAHGRDPAAGAVSGREPERP